MYRNFDLILLRHAQAQHNVVKRELKQKKNHKKGEKKGREFHELKLNEKFRDQHITEKGEKQCKEIAEILDWNSIDLIIVSPLRRCLDTCRKVLEYSGRNVQVLVEPYITAMVTSTWSLGSMRKDLQKQYPQFKFQKLNDNPKIPWYLKHFCNLKLSKIRQLQDHSKMLQNGIKEDPYEFRLRVQKFGKVLHHELQRLKVGSRILIISHNKVFAMMTAKIFNEKGKGVSDLKFDNAEINYVSSCRCFCPISPSL